MTTLSKPKPGEIWLAYLEYSDKPGIGKVRPVLILEEESKKVVVLAAKVTSVRSCDNSTQVELKNWSSYGLVKPSFVRTNQKFRVSLDKILGDKPLGKLENELFEKIFDAIKAVP